MFWQKYLFSCCFRSWNLAPPSTRMKKPIFAFFSLKNIYFIGIRRSDTNLTATVTEVLYAQGGVEGAEGYGTEQACKAVQEVVNLERK